MRFNAPSSVYSLPAGAVTKHSHGVQTKRTLPPNCKQSPYLLFYSGHITPSLGERDSNDVQNTPAIKPSWSAQWSGRAGPRTKSAMWVNRFGTLAAASSGFIQRVMNVRKSNSYPLQLNNNDKHRSPYLNECFATLARPFRESCAHAARLCERMD